MTRILRADFGGADELEENIAHAMVIARRRAHMSEDQFALTLRRRCRRDPGLTGASIRAYETGRSRPRTDVYLRALMLGGVDVPARFRQLLQQLAIPVALLSATQRCLLLHAAMAATAPISPWW